MTSNDIPPMLKVMKIVMTKSYFRRLWWERKISSYRNQLEIDLLEAIEKVNRKAIAEIKRKIDACNKWLKRFSLDLGNLKDAQLEVVFDIIDNIGSNPDVNIHALVSDSVFVNGVAQTSWTADNRGYSTERGA